MLSSAPPPEDHPCGILSFQIHQVTGLELEAMNKNTAGKNDEDSDEEEGSVDLPSSYCTIILNHQKIFRTRTKPKNGKPFVGPGPVFPLSTVPSTLWFQFCGATRADQP